MNFNIWIIALILIVLWILYGILIDKTVVKEYQKGLLFRHGRFKKYLRTGINRIFRPGSEIMLFDARRKIISVPGQELLTSDNVGIKITTVVLFETIDPLKLINTVEDSTKSLYLAVQLSLRSEIGNMSIDELLENRNSLSEKLLSHVSGTAEEFGIKVHSVDIKDIMFPGELKNIFSEVIRARKESLASLERARGEQATLRNLANSSRMLENNPALYEMWKMHKISSAAGNTIVWDTGTDKSFLKNKSDKHDKLPAADSGYIE